jgi:demethylmenaquinone methyltransferase/2-methoxy-6-polyprenyl-1,4-benzoquinol methylase
MEILDIAAGTGSSSRPLADKGASVTCLDFSEGMLAAGRTRNPDLTFIQGDALKLPFPDQSFDVTTISFGLRNTHDAGAALTEAHRVTKAGGKIVIAEFSHPTNPLFRYIYMRYLMRALPVIAKRVASNPEAYIYLAQSIQAWPNQKDLASIMEKSGWGNIAWQDLSFGIVAVHIGQK